MTWSGFTSFGIGLCLLHAVACSWGARDARGRGDAGTTAQARTAGATGDAGSATKVNGTGDGDAGAAADADTKPFAETPCCRSLTIDYERIYPCHLPHAGHPLLFVRSCGAYHGGWHYSLTDSELVSFSSNGSPQDLITPKSPDLYRVQAKQLRALQAAIRNVRPCAGKHGRIRYGVRDHCVIEVTVDTGEQSCEFRMPCKRELTTADDLAWIVPFQRFVYATTGSCEDALAGCGRNGRPKRP